MDRDQLDIIHGDKRVILKQIVNKQDERALDVFIWLRTGTSNGLF
jgi:hypothetical protein